MNGDAFDLLDRLCKGDDNAVAQAFSTYAPYLNVVVRRWLSFPLRAKLDTTDIVQSVWSDLVPGFRQGNWQFSNHEQFRAFLVKAARNRFLNRVRRHRRALEHEQALSEMDEAVAAPAQPSPWEEAQANDLWERMLAECPPTHRDLLLLKRQGLSLDELAERSGLHPSSVRRIFYDLARRLACSGQL
jgi:RNA polymerase sigma-70 factor (ECF subfamily)